MRADLTEDAADAAFVHRADVIDQRVGCSGQAAWPWLEGRVESTLAWCSGDGDDADERETLIGDDIGITDDDARADAPLLMTDRRFEIEQQDGGRDSLVGLGPTRAGCPADRFAGSGINESLGVFLGEALDPLVEAGCSEILALRVGMLDRPPELFAASAFELAPDGFQYEPASVPPAAIDLAENFARKCDRDPLGVRYVLLKI